MAQKSASYRTLVLGTKAIYASICLGGVSDPSWVSFTNMPSLQSATPAACISGASWVVGVTYLEGHGDLVSRLVMGIIRILIWLIRASSLLNKSP